MCIYVCKLSLCTCMYMYMCVFMIFSGIPTLLRPLVSDVPLTDLALMFEGKGKDRKFNISEFLISFEAWAKLSQKWLVRIHLEPIN